VDLHVLGWNHFFERYWNANARGGVMPGRVVEEQKEAYRVVGKSGEFAAEVTGRLRHEASGRADFPAVGDWVVMDTIPSEEKALIHEVLPRRTKLSRKVAGDRSSEQILVTNVDVAFVVMSLSRIAATRNGAWARAVRASTPSLISVFDDSAMGQTWAGTAGSDASSSSGSSKSSSASKSRSSSSNSNSSSTGSSPSSTGSSSTASISGSVAGMVSAD